MPDYTINTREREYEEPIVQIQGLKSFCKVRDSWLQYGKFKLDFVKHSGKPACTPEGDPIKGAIPVFGEGGVMNLYHTVTDAAMLKRAIEKAGTNGAYANPFFKTMGGTVSKRSATGTAIFRQISIARGAKSDFVLSAMECEGEENQTGGIQPKRGAEKNTINVPLSYSSLVDFASAMYTEYIAFRSGNIGVKPDAANEQPDTPLEAAAPGECKPAKVAIMYDSMGLLNNATPKAAVVSNAVDLLKEMITELLNLHGYVANKSDYEKAVATINNGDNATVGIAFSNKKDPSDKLTLVIAVDDLC